MGKELYSVQKILDRRPNPTTGEIEYKIKWKGYPYSQCTWEPFYHLSYVSEQVEEFNKNHLLKKQNPEKTHKIHKPTKNNSVQGKVQKRQKESQSDQISKGRAKQANKEINQSNPSQIKQNFAQMQNSESEEGKKDWQKKDLKNQKSEAAKVQIDQKDDPFIDRSLGNEIQVVQVASNKKGELFFYLKFPQKLKWVSHRTMKSEYQVELINYYEKYMTFGENYQKLVVKKQE